MNPFSFGATEGFSFTIPQNEKKKETDATNSFEGFSFGTSTPVHFNIPKSFSTLTTFGETTSNEKDTGFSFGSLTPVQFDIPRSFSTLTTFGTSNGEDEMGRENKTKKKDDSNPEINNWRSFPSSESDSDCDYSDGSDDFYEKRDNSILLNIDDFDTLIWEDGTQQRISLLQSRIEKVKRNLDGNTQEFPQNSFESWKEAQTYLKEKFDQTLSILGKEQVNGYKIQSHITNLEYDLIETNREIQNLLKRKKKIENDITTAEQLKMKFDKQFQSIEKKHDMLLQMCTDVSLFCENECKMNTAIEKLFEQKSFENFDCSDISKLLWKMDLTKYQQIFEENQINGKIISMMNVDWATWKLMGIKKRDCFYMTFYFEMFQIPGFYRTLSNEDLNDCVVCSHSTPEKTIHLLEEYEISIERELILKNNYCTPILIFPKSLKDLNIDLLSQRGKQIMLTLAKWRKLHELHLKTIRKYHKQCKINK